MEESFEQEVERTVAVLKAGKTILYPTDTIWGVGCDATNNKACLRVYAVKQRPLNKSLIILVDSVERLQDYVVSVPAIAYDLIKGAKSPLSIIYPESKNLAKAVSDDKSICIRVVDNELQGSHSSPREAHHLDLGQPYRTTFIDDFQRHLR